jgi:1-acyl-sn-glycerol-3-phosphate acyltransferase
MTSITLANTVVHQPNMRVSAPKRRVALDSKLKQLENSLCTLETEYLPTRRPAVAAPKYTPPRECLNGPDPVLMKRQAGLAARLMDTYFRLEISGWDNLPKQPALLIGGHSGGPLTMDAWTIAYAWWRHFEGSRTLHATAHDVLMKTPGLGRYFRRNGVISPTCDSIQAAFAQGDDVILWPGGEKDAFRSWSKRDKVVLGGRTGFIRMAIRTNTPIVPVATVGGHDTLFVLSEGRWLAKLLNLKKHMRSEVAPITLSFPLGLAIHVTPLQHIPLPAKIRTAFLEPVYFDGDPELANDPAYVQRKYQEVEHRIQAGMDQLAKRRKFPVFG